MSSSEQLDLKLGRWAVENGLKLFRTSPSEPARAAFISNKHGDCCQIYAYPRGGYVIVRAVTIERHDDDELEAEWEVNIDELDMALRRALTQVHKWMET